MSGAPHRRQANPRPRSLRMAGPPQQASRQSRLAIHNRQRPRQAEETVPSVRVTRATSGAGNIERRDDAVVVDKAMLVLGAVLVISDNRARVADADHTGEDRSRGVERRDDAVIVDESMHPVAAVGYRSDNLTSGVDAGHRGAGSSGDIDRRNAAAVVDESVDLVGAVDIVA